MLWGDRPDGTRVRDLTPLQAMMPHVIPTRNGAAVYHEQTLDLTRTLPWLQKHPGITLFHLVLCGIVRTLAARPRMHRFVAGGRIWQRKRIELSFAVKKRFTDDGGLTAVKVGFEPGDSLADVVRRTGEVIGTGRGDRPTTAEREMAITARMPAWLLAIVMRLQRLLDGWNLLPAALTRDDPLYCSVFLANLGSVGLDAPWHHLFEYGTCPIFVVVGRVRRAAVVADDGSVAVRDVVTMRYTFDERIADGLYCAKSLELFRRVVEDPDSVDVKVA